MQLNVRAYSVMQYYIAW
uniref:Uncharacterized protein n=1 Tax=Arundo donax TaxID=35708 RepID=A0A0A9SPZ2_ARUDO